MKTITTITLLVVVAISGFGMMHNPIIAAENLPTEKSSQKVELISKTFDVKEYHSIKGGSALNVTIIQDGQEGLTASMPAQHIEKFSPKVVDGVLHLDWSSLLSKDMNNLNVVIHLKQEPRAFIFSQGTDIKIKGILSFTDLDIKLSNASDMEEVMFKGRTLRMQISGASDFQGQINVDKLNMEQSGSSDSKAKINAKEVYIRVSGASEHNSKIMADKLSISASGSSEVKGEWQIEDLLDLRLSGASDCELEGSSRRCEAEITGASSLEAYRFSTGLLKLKGSGASNAEMTVHDRIEVELSGASNLKYKGTPQTDQNLSGRSRVERQK